MAPHLAVTSAGAPTRHSTFAEMLVPRLQRLGVILAILALLWVVALTVLFYFIGELNRDSLGGASLLTVIAALFLKSFLPDLSPKTRQVTQVAPQASDSAREVVETVVFVVVLVLLLKSFAAEAFVIPTGSMAETLWGYQKVVPCPQCGLKFPVNCSSEVDPPDGSPPSYVGDCTCPNCRQRIHMARTSEELRADPGPGNILDPKWHSGDRVLVAKFVYDLFRRPPDRLDVVVFRFPGDDDSQRSPFPISGPSKKQVPINYIKRLIGLPGETIAINRGKLFVLSPEESTKLGLVHDDVAQAGDDLSKKIQLWRFDKTYHDEEKAKDLFKEGKFEIIRKKPDNLLSMRRLVYDNDHQAKDLAKNPEFQRWKPADKSAWVARIVQDTKNFEQNFEHKGDGAGSIDWLRYRHILRGNDKPELITDFMGYNTDRGGTGGNWASDLMVECQVEVLDTKGTFALELSRGPERYQALFDLATGTCTLYRIKEGKEPEELKSVATKVKSRGKYVVRFANADDRLVVWVDERLPFDDGVLLETPKTLVPIKENDLDRPVSIGSRNAAVAVAKIVLYRDTYYTTGSRNGPNGKDVDKFELGRPDAWPELENAPVSTYYVQPGHFLCLGDNSPQSSDGRSWGLVPKRLLLGRALLIYFPFSRAGRIR